MLWSYLGLLLATNPAPAPVPAPASASTLATRAGAATLAARIQSPAGFIRVSLAQDHFGSFLRALPMMPEGAPVLSHRGDVVLAASDPRIAGVVDLDIGTGDLQQCADSILRLHAEWRWGQGARDHQYAAYSGATLRYQDWLKGARYVPKGRSLSQVAGTPRADSYASFRHYLDEVFRYANTVAIARDYLPSTLRTLQPGDFLVQGGTPGHAVLVLDVAQDSEGHRQALLGQGYMPAQSFQVLRDSSGSPWFSLDGTEVQTPFWKAFTDAHARRMDRTRRARP